MPVKECFGQCANMSVRYRDHSKQHYLRIDDDKLKECDVCDFFAKCMFVRYNETLKEMLRLIDQAGHDPKPRLG